MTADVDKWIGKCNRCIRRKTSTNIRAELVSIDTTYPLELVCIDYLSLETSKGGFGNILVITDHFAKYALAIPTKNQTAKTTAEAIYNNFILNYGIPSKLHCDQGANFESEIIKELCQLTGIKKTRTAPYHPMGNGQTERYNRTLLNMLGTLEDSQKGDWKKYLPSLVCAYNCTKHETTKISPFELMFGRKPKLPLDTVFEAAYTGTSSSKNTREYIEDLRDRMERTKNIVKKYTEISQKKQKYHFDKKAKAVRLHIGDSVLIKILAFEGKHEIADRFEEDVYRVIEQPRADIPVYKVRSEKGVNKTQHRNHMLPVEQDDTGDSTDEGQQVNQQPNPDEKQPEDKSVGELDTVEKDASDSKDKNKVLPLELVVQDETESDSEDTDDEDGYENVAPTFIHGDAHDLVHKVASKDSKHIEETVAGTEETEVIAEGEIVVEEEVDDTETIVVEGNLTDDPVKDVEQNSYRKPMTKTKRTIDGAEGETEPGVTCSKEGTKVKMKPPTTKEDELPRQQPIPLPRPQLRRSDRERKEPKRYEAYQMNQMVPRPYDCKLNALQKALVC